MKKRYKARFKELEIIGKGNYGSATLIQRKTRSKNEVSEANVELLIAKKVMIKSMNEKDQQKALQEASLMKNLKHPNIVEFHESFIEDGLLYIIMEYCEEGDLSHHIKRNKKRNKQFSDKQILNWFVQIAIFNFLPFSTLNYFLIFMTF